MNIEEWLDDIPQKHKRHFYAAYVSALNSQGTGTGNYRLGAVICNRSVVVSAGHNSYKTHPKLVEVTDYPHLHAEQHAMFKYGLNNCSGLTMYVVRVTRNGDISISKPCDICQHFIREADIISVYYSRDIGFGKL